MIDRKSVEVLKDRSDVIKGGVLVTMQEVEFWTSFSLWWDLRGTPKKGVAIIYAGNDQIVNRNGSAIVCEEWTEVITLA